MPSERAAFTNLVRKQLAYQGLEADKTLSLTAEQHKEIKDNLKRLTGDLAEGVRRLYRQLYLPARTGWKTIDLGLPTVGDIQALDHEVYDRLRMEGEILEKVAPLVIKEKFLHSRDWVSTSQLYQASLKTPGEARTTNQSVWENGIAEGVRKGLFGIGELEDEKAIYRYFKEETTPSFAEDEILIKAEICEAQKASEEGQTKYPPGIDIVPTGSVDESGKAGTTAVTPPVNIGGFPPTNTVDGLTQLSFNFVVPKGKVSNLMGLLNFLQSRYNRIEISLNLAEGQLTEQEYEDKIKEAFRQMGVDID